MINFLVIAIGIVFALISGGFALWSAKNTRKINTRQKYYDEFMERKSKREKLHIPR
ncbi:hypothetical protein ACIPZC_24220 [Pseudomonas sp. NPDC089743]|uniref:hypothetical protein n=1 Tax=Pseudomonas sp. NPDC089743 TaxID=3364471 RepID=UPI003817EFB0